MTDSTGKPTGKPISWLEYKASVTGKTVEEIRQDMREKSLKADKSKSGFASLSPERLREIHEKSIRTRQKKATNGQSKDRHS